MPDKYKLFFANIPEIGLAAIRRLKQEGYDEEDAYNNKNECCKQLLTPRQYEIYQNAKQNIDVNKILETLQVKEINVSIYGDALYPERLKNIPNPPYQLFYKGQLPGSDIPSVSIIGARNCSEYGRKVAKYFGEELASNKVAVISGMASGIDGISQGAALSRNGNSFAVVGSGVDICYPASNRDLYEQLINSGGVISELPPGTKPLAQNFPLRNRIISGLSDIVLVIEAREKSGTSITVNMALEQGRTIYAVPGRINDSLSIGCNKMISEGAGIARNVDDLLNELGIKGYKSINNDSGYSRCDSDIKKEIYTMLKNKALTCDDIYRQLNNTISVSELKVILLEMVMEEIIIENGSFYMTMEM